MSSNHSLYLIKIFDCSYPEGNFGGNQLPVVIEEVVVGWEGIGLDTDDMYRLYALLKTDTKGCKVLTRWLD